VKRKLIAVAMLSALVLLLLPSPAMAADELPVPDSSGNYAHCALKVSQASGSGNYYRAVSCQYGPTDGYVTALVLTITLNGTPGTTWNQWSGGTAINTQGRYQAWMCSGGCGTGSGTPTVVVTACTVTISGASIGSLSSKPCTVDTTTVVVGATSGYLAFPNDYYPGGEPGNAAVVPCVTSTPASGTRTGTVVVNFDASCSTGKSGATFAWNFHSSGTGSDTSGRQVSRTYSSDGDYDVTLTISKGGADTTYDFVYVVGVVDTGTEGDDEDCGAFWHVVCYASLLFIPDTAALEASWDDTFDSATTNYPFGPAIWAGDSVSDTMDGFREGVEYGAAHPDADSDTCVGGVDTVDTPVGDLPVVDLVVPFSGDCAEEDKPGFIVDFQTWAIRISTIILAFGFLMFVRRQIQRLTGDGGDAEAA